jgi:hypothetical protein
VSRRDPDGRARLARLRRRDPALAGVFDAVIDGLVPVSGTKAGARAAAFEREAHALLQEIGRYDPATLDGLLACLRLIAAGVRSRKADARKGVRPVPRGVA